MKIIKSIFLSGIITLSIVSCKKEGKSNPEPTVYPNYSMLKPGNYWIYERFKVDTLGNSTSQHLFDSCYVEKDTIVDGETFHKLVKPDPFMNGLTISNLLRDSLGYTIDIQQNIIFSSSDFEREFKSTYFKNPPADTVCRTTYMMTDKNEVVTVPAGIFITSNFKISYFMWPNWSMAGSNRRVNNRFAENIGQVVETLPFFAQNPDYTERWLLRYHVE